MATGDVDGDGIAEIITGSGQGTRGHIKAFKGGFNTVIRSFFAYGPSISSGVFVASGDLDGDGQAEIVASLAQGSLPTVRIFKGAMLAPTKSSKRLQHRSVAVQESPLSTVRIKPVP